MTRALRPLRSEWTKLRTMPSTPWLLAATIGGTVLIGAAAAQSVDLTHCPPQGCVTDPVKVSLTGVWLGQAVVAVLAVLPITDEFGTGMLRSTLMAEPRRLRVLLAKAGVLTAATLATGAAAVSGSLLAARILLPDPAAQALGAAGTARAAVGTVCYLALVGLLALGLGTILRDTAAAITIVLGLLYGWPVVASFVADPEWSERLQQVGPTTAGMAIQATTGLADLPIGPWPGLGVLALYALAALLLGAVLLRARDV